MSKNKIEKQDLLNLLGFYYQILPPRWQSLQTYINIYITLLSAILGVVIAGLDKFKTYPINFILEIGPMLILILSSYAKKIIKRQNEHIKEAIAMVAKIEYELGLYEKVSLIDGYNKTQLWPNDESFILPRWVKLRIESGKNSEDFVKRFQESSAKYSYKDNNNFQIFAIILNI